MTLLLDPEQVTWLSGQVSDAAADFDETINEPATYTVRDSSAFGNTASASDCFAAWGVAVGKALGAAGALRGAMRRDVDRLAEVVETFRRLDDEQADRILAAGSRMTFISSHVHHNDEDLPGRWNDLLRARQLDRLVDHAAGLEGPVAVGGDNNLSLIDLSLIDSELLGTDRLGPEALERFQEEGYENVGDVSDQGGTLEESGRTIDHIHARGVEAGDPTLVDGGPSDHHGQAVTYRLTDW